jgi:chromosome segregation ATPase
LDKRKEESLQSAAAAEELHARVLAGEQRAATLESNLKAGQELIESLQQDLRNLPELERRLAASEEELERLSGERESKNELIESLQNDVRDLTRARKRMREQDAEISRVRTELEQEKQALSNAQTELAELRSGHADANLAERLEEKEKAINVLSGALRNRDSAVATLTRKIDDLKQQYADLENQYVSTNPTMPSLTAIPDKGAGSGGRD